MMTDRAPVAPKIKTPAERLAELQAEREQNEAEAEALATRIIAATAETWTDAGPVRVLVPRADMAHALVVVGTPFFGQMVARLQRVAAAHGWVVFERADDNGRVRLVLGTPEQFEAYERVKTYFKPRAKEGAE